MTDLRVAPERRGQEGTGIYVRAKDVDERWISADIASLTRESLDRWLRSRDSIEWPIGVVMILLGWPNGPQEG